MTAPALRTQHLYWIRVRSSPERTLYWNVCLASDARRAHQILLRRTRVLRAHLVAVDEPHWLDVSLLGACRVRGRSTIPPGWSYTSLPTEPMLGLRILS